MIIFVEARTQVASAFKSQFERIGAALVAFVDADFEIWLAGATKAELASVECFLIGDVCDRAVYVKLVKGRSHAPVIALSEHNTLERTLDLFACGVDDVVRKPVHVRELLARVRAIQRRSEAKAEASSLGAIRVFCDGRDPEVDGCEFPLPRRERRILEFLASHRGRRVTKAQIFHSIYGLFDDEVDENVVESHVSKLRKKLKARMGYDPIDSKRFLGYCLLERRPQPVAFHERASIARMPASMPAHALHA
ncbi:MAG TPA: winged helix-turn-helix domain-containing protein [Rhodoblastus sp.]|nr:winged helix-turn-helix domain-containing protein [Rhodoblastus sp.]